MRRNYMGYDRFQAELSGFSTRETARRLRSYRATGRCSASASARLRSIGDLLHSMADEQEERREIEVYLDQHHLQEFIGDAVNDIVQERPKDPLVKLADSLRSCSEASRQIQELRGRQILNGEALPALEVEILTGQVLATLCQFLTSAKLMYDNQHFTCTYTKDRNFRGSLRIVCSIIASGTITEITYHTICQLISLLLDCPVISLQRWTPKSDRLKFSPAIFFQCNTRSSFLYNFANPQPLIFRSLCATGHRLRRRELGTLRWRRGALRRSWGPSGCGEHRKCPC